MMIDMVTTYLCTTCNEYFEAYEMASIDEHLCEECAERMGHAVEVEELEQRIKELEAELTTLRATLESTRQRLERAQDSSIAEAVRFEQLETEIAALRNELELSMKETGDLRQAITEAIGMPWDEQPQPLGGMGYACPDDVRIVEFVANMRARIAECESDAVTVPDDVLPKIRLMIDAIMDADHVDARAETAAWEVQAWLDKQESTDGN